MSLTFELINKNNQNAIKCLICGRISYNSNDIKYEFCGNCHEYHSKLKLFKDESNNRTKKG